MSPQVPLASPPPVSEEELLPTQTRHDTRLPGPAPRLQATEAPRRSGLTWAGLLTGYVAGQGLVQAVNTINGLIVLRWLSTPEYALYTVATYLCSLTSVGSELGLSQGLISIGAAEREDRDLVGRLFASASLYRRRLTLLMMCVLPIGFWILARGHGWKVTSILFCMLFSAGVTWLQPVVGMHSSALNIFRDARGLLLSGALSAVVRMVLVLVAC